MSVHHVKCSDYDEKRVFEAISSTLDAHGGISSLVKRGDRILLKPNLLRTAAPDAGVVTHPEIMKALSKLLMDAGARVSIGDSPCIHSARQVLEKAGMKDFFRNNDVSITEFKTPYPVHSSTARVLRDIIYAKEVLDFDGIINLPKLKTHCLVYFTSAMKNLYGCICGKEKHKIHLKIQDSMQFADAVLDIYESFPGNIILNITDAVVSMEGFGPSNGPLTKTGFIVSGENTAEVDHATVVLSGHDPMDFPYLSKAVERNLVDPVNIRKTGDTKNISLGRKFEIPETGMDLISARLPTWLDKPFRNLLVKKPKIRKDLCIGCAACKKICPAEAIEMIGGKATINHTKCIKCYCCMEACPEDANAVRIRGNVFQKMFDVVWR